METDPKSIVATFSEPRNARATVRGLIEAGVDADDIGIAVADSAEARALLEGGPAKPGEAATIGSAVGGTLFGLAAVVMAGPVGILAVGPLAALLGGVAAGAGTGALLGALIGLGIPENEAALRVDEVQDGGWLVTCKLSTHADDKLQAIFDRNQPLATFCV